MKRNSQRIRQSIKDQRKQHEGSPVDARSVTFRSRWFEKNIAAKIDSIVVITYLSARVTETVVRITMKVFVRCVRHIVGLLLRSGDELRTTFER